MGTLMQWAPHQQRPSMAVRQEGLNLAMAEDQEAVVAEVLRVVHQAVTAFAPDRMVAQ